MRIEPLLAVAFVQLGDEPAHVHKLLGRQAERFRAGATAQDQLRWRDVHRPG